MNQKVSRRILISARLMAFGCFLFVIYGIVAAVFSAPIAVYEYSALSGGDLMALPETVRQLAGSMIFRIGLLGAGLSICAGTLFWIGLTRKIAPAFFAGLIGGLLGLGPLSGAHMQQGAWFMFIADNICLLWIGLGFLIGGKGIFDLFSSNKDQSNSL